MDISGSCRLPINPPLRAFAPVSPARLRDAMKDFEYFEPATLDDAVALLKRYRGSGTLFAGGTDLLVQMKEHVRQPAQVINIK